MARVFETGTAEEWKSLFVAAARAQRPDVPLEGPLCVDIDLFFPRPKNRCRRSDPDGSIRHTAKPDRDNADKAILDALTQDGWWRDDSQVCDGRVRKLYHPKDGRPGARITVRALADQEVA